ncbi:hypothetical protein [Salinimicrobium oceani]|uniref:hypothetical protein n=1 Tax=Salinimicrobium oceani TaxID=2722702 RepID=UPI001F1B97C1|nr:hypothetical protein [Salinimicrobium oceani]
MYSTHNIRGIGFAMVTIGESYKGLDSHMNKNIRNKCIHTFLMASKFFISPISLSIPAPTIATSNKDGVVGVSKA